MSKPITSKHALAATLGCDIKELSDMRYKSTRMISAIYSTETHYYAVKKTIPTDIVGKEWTKHKDQFWAEKANTIIWICEVED